MPAARAPLAQIASGFAIEGEPLSAERLGRGHIHETWLSSWRRPGGAARRFVHQRINTHVFREPEQLMENVARVTAHVRERVRRHRLPDAERRCLAPVAARAGGFLVRDDGGAPWRSFAFIEGTRSLDAVEGAAQAHEAARAFGAFAELVSDLTPGSLHATIPHFHDMPRRLTALEDAARADARGRAGAAQPVLDAMRACAEALARRLPPREIDALPRRVVHHDCKLDNVLFDADTGEALCVIDLDTVMEGALLSDFGELVRTAACPAPEDEPDPSRIVFDLALFEALAAGYLAGAHGLLEPSEREALPLAGSHLALMNAVRFLTDHLEGDVYFRAHRPGHNLDRARAQLRLAEQMLAREAETARIVAERWTG